MGRREKYSTEEERKEAQARRNEEIKLNPEKKEKKKKTAREYYHKNQEDQEKLRTHPDSLARLADPTTQQRLLQELKGKDVDKQPITRPERDEVTEIYCPPDENLPVEFTRRLPDEHESGIQYLCTSKANYLR